MLRQSVPNLAGKLPRNIDPGLHLDIDQTLSRAQLLHGSDSSQVLGAWSARFILQL